MEGMLSSMRLLVLRANMHKRCPGCKVYRANFEFGRRSGSRSHQLRGQCKGCEANKQRIRLQDPVQKLKAIEYEKNNRDKAAIRAQRWRERNPEKAKESQRKSGPEALRRWREKNGPAVQRAKESTRLRQRGLRNKESQEYYHIIKYDGCSYCSNSFEHIDHIEPTVDGGSHEWHNLTSSCAFCNMSKSSRTLLNFLLYKRRPE